MKKRYLTRIAWKTILCGAIICTLYIGGQLYAQTDTPIIPGLLEDGIRVWYDMWSIKWFAETAEYALKILYLILWPILTVAAAAMDNSLVYWWAFYLTSALFKFWQIIRTFANYTIWLYFVWSILAAFFGNKLENVFSGLIKNVAIAWIIVNMSWWILAALIDLSTVATFALGALPLHALKDDTVFQKNVYFLKTHTNLNLTIPTEKNADKLEFSILYSCTQPDVASPHTRYYLTCATDDRKLLTEWAEGKPLTWKQFKKDFVEVRKNDTKVKTEDIDDYYCVYDNKIIRNDFGADISDCKVLQQLMVDGKEEGISQCAKVDQILTKSTHMTWPLFTLYSSILRASELGITTNAWSVKQVSLELLIKLVFWIALIIPLIALGVVMVIRVVYLWLIIAFSPLITIAAVLKWWDKISWKIDGVLSNIFKPDQIVSLIFLPVIATFGLSISIIFLSLLQTLPLIEREHGKTESAITPKDECSNDAVTALGMQRNETKEWVSYDFDIVDVNFTQKLRETGADIGNIMSWLVINFFGIAFMWMVVFATLKTNEFTKWVVEEIDKASRAFMSTVPLPFAWWLWVSALKTVPEKLKQKYADQWLEEQTSLIDSKIDEFAASNSTDKKILNQKFSAAQQDPSQIDDWLNDQKLVRNTDFLSDYEPAAKAFAQKAKTYFVDKNWTLTKAWQAYAQANNLSQKDITDNLDKVSDWNNALQNKEFVHWMHSQWKWGKWWYDEFYTARDLRDRKDNSTIKVMEDWLAKISWSSNTWSKLFAENTIHWYLYENDTMLTTFERNKSGNKFIWSAPKSYTLPKDGNDINKLTTNDIDTFNFMMSLNNPRFDTLPFFKALKEQQDKNEITVQNKKYKPIKNQETWAFEWFTPLDES